MLANADTIHPDADLVAVSAMTLDATHGHTHVPPLHSYACLICISEC